MMLEDRDNSLSRSRRMSYDHWLSTGDRVSPMMAKTAQMFTPVHFQADDAKLGELMLYIAQRSEDDPFFGATKLNKILYHVDFGAYRRWLRPITGHAYFRLKEGPAPQVLVKVRDRLIEDGAARMANAEVYGFKQKRLQPKRPANQSLFTDAELALVEDVIQSMQGMTAAQVSAASHRLPGWKAAKDREVIPYETAFLSGQVTDADFAWAFAMALEHGWL